jgi:hypothetical protein
MARSRIFGKILNPIIKSILKSPLHSLMSDRSLVIRYMERESGRANSFPAYYQRAGNSLLVLVEKAQDWWRDLRNGANVKVVIKGSEQRGWAEALQNPDVITENLIQLLRAIPELSMELEIRQDEHGVYLKEDINRILQQYGLLNVDLQAEQA